MSPRIRCSGACSRPIMSEMRKQDPTSAGETVGEGTSNWVSSYSGYDSGKRDSSACKVDYRLTTACTSLREDLSSQLSPADPAFLLWGLVSSVAGWTVHYPTKSVDYSKVCQRAVSYLEMICKVLDGVVVADNDRLSTVQLQID